MNPLISVIVPVYNVEKYIDRCVTSIVEQTYENLEIILVDDGSPDNSGALCDEWAKKDSRIKVFHKENGGLSDARNAGTKLATGEYITYIDSDDYILPEYVEHLYRNIILHSADISCCDFQKVYNYTTNFDNTTEDIQCISGRDSCLKMFEEDGVYFVIAPCKLYKIDIVREYEFPKGLINEDEATTYKYLYESKRVCTSARKLYGYFQNPKGIMHNITDNYYQNVVSIITLRAKYFREHNDFELEDKCWGYLYPFSIYCHLEVQKRISIKDFIYLIKNGFKKVTSSKEKLKLLLYFVSPAIYKKMMTTVGKR
ncbi:MAG: glycosyltransferase family 2 protein [Clostridia bacterium]|nr:glycosyltransferase family 2 protein [Clostridia bacterium]